MLKKGIDLNVTPIKPTARDNNKELEDLLYKINDELYFFRNLFINKKAKDYLLGRIEFLGKQVKEVQTTQPTRKQYILGELRDIYRNLNSYIPSENGVLDIDPEIEKMNKYMVGLFLKDKRENKLTITSKLDWIKKLKYFSQFYQTTENLKSVQQELLDFFKI